MTDNVEGHKSENTLLLKDFLIPPSHIQKFQWNEINRSNFINWLETSFSISQGNPESQYAFFEWSRLNLGFDYQTALDSFSKSSKVVGWIFLAREEKESVRKSFSSVKNHGLLSITDADYDPNDTTYVFNAIRNQISLVFNAKKRADLDGRSYLPPINDINGMSSMEFKKQIAIYNQNRPRSVIG